MKIKEFWETRVDGSQAVWSALYKICEEPDEKTCKKHLKKNRLTLPNGTISQVIDDRGHRYDLPVFVINKPIKFGKPKELKPDEPPQRVDQEFNITLRMAGRNDWKTGVKSTDLIESLKKSFKDSLGIEKTIRLFYNGRELKDSAALGSFKLHEGCVLIAY